MAVIFDPQLVRHPRAFWILSVLLIGVICQAAIAPFVAYYIVEGLGEPSWKIGFYYALNMSASLIINRYFGEKIDAGTKIAPLILITIVTYFTAVVLILSFQSYWVLILVCSVCFGFSNAGVSAMYTYGRFYAESVGLDINRFNALLRTMTSIGWMIAPGVSYSVAFSFGTNSVFIVALLLSLFWVALWAGAIPSDAASPKKEPAQNQNPGHENSWPLRLGAAVCFSFALGFLLCNIALPLFYVQDVGLPEYAPGLALVVKGCFEIVGIMSGPWLILRFRDHGTLRWTAVLAIVTFFAIAEVTTISQLILASIFEGLAYGSFAGVGLTFMQQFAHGRLARATSMYMNSIFLAVLLSGATMGLIAYYTSYETVIRLASCGPGIALAILLLVDWKADPKSQPI